MVNIVFKILGNRDLENDPELLNSNKKVDKIILKLKIKKEFYANYTIAVVVLWLGLTTLLYWAQITYFPDLSYVVHSPVFLLIHTSNPFDSIDIIIVLIFIISYFVAKYSLLPYFRFLSNK